MAAGKAKGSYTGVFLSPEGLEVTQFDPQAFRVLNSFRFDIPPGILSDGIVLDPTGLSAFLKATLSQISPKIQSVHLTLPSTLLRLIEMPKLSGNDLGLSLSSEAERYKTFDGTDAVVDFEVLPPLDTTPGNSQRVIFTALRKDTFDLYRKSFQSAKIRIETIEVQSFSVLRAMAGTGVLDSLVEQIGPNAQWGTLFVEPERIHFSIWQQSQLIEFREISMSTLGIEEESAHSPIIEELIEEIRRTAASTTPAIWLVNNLPPVVSGWLSEQLNTPFRPCILGPTLDLDQPGIQLATVGAAMANQVRFPFAINFMKVQSQTTTASGKTTSSAAPEAVNPMAGLMMGFAVASLLILGVVTGGMMLYEQLAINSQLVKIEQEHMGLTTEVANLQQQVNLYKAQYNLRAMVVDVIESAKTKNALYTSLTNDLRQMTPGKVWLYNVEVGDRITLEGKALHHQPVVDFARQFDHLVYSKQVLFDEIKEEVDSDQPVFKFKISGQPFLDKGLLSGITHKPLAEDLLKVPSNVSTGSKPAPKQGAF